jgi:hypothetical protein
VCGGGGGAHVTQLLQLALAPTQRREIGREIALEIGREIALGVGRRRRRARCVRDDVR